MLIAWPPKRASPASNDTRVRTEGLKKRSAMRRPRKSGRSAPRLILSARCRSSSSSVSEKSRVDRKWRFTFDPSLTGPAARPPRASPGHAGKVPFRGSANVPCRHAARAVRQAFADPSSLSRGGALLRELGEEEFAPLRRRAVDPFEQHGELEPAPRLRNVARSGANGAHELARRHARR